MQAEQQAGAEIGQAMRLDPEGRQAKGRIVGPEQAARMRLEGHDAQRRAQGLRLLARRPQHGLMAAMHAVEIAERHNGAPRRRRQGRIMPEYLHGLSCLADNPRPDQARRWRCCRAGLEGRDIARCRVVEYAPGLEHPLTLTNDKDTVPLGLAGFRYRYRPRRR